MEELFDPYLQWLGIRDPARPPNHYRLLGIDLFESDADVISSAADRQMAYVRGFQTGPRAQHSQRILNELAAARVCLLRPEQKREYDVGLRHRLETPVPAPPPDFDFGAPTTVPSFRAIAQPGPPPIRPTSTADPTLNQGESEFSFEEYPRSAARRRSKRASSLAPLLAVGALALLAVAAVSIWLNRQNWAASSRSAEQSDQRATATELSVAGTEESSNGKKSGELEADAASVTATTSSAPTEDASVITEPSEAASAEQLAHLLADARLQLALREIPKAQKALAAAKILPVSAVKRSELERLERIAGRLERFWNAVDRGLSLLMPGDRLMLKQQLVAVEAVGEQLVTSYAEAQTTQSWPLARQQIDAELAIVVAERAWDASAGSSLVAVSTFWAMDREADREQSRQLLARSEFGEVETSDLLAELEVPLPEAALASSKPITQNDPPTSPDVHPAGVSSGKLKPLSDEELAPVVDRIRGMYSGQLTSAADVEAKAAVARRLDMQAASVQAPTERLALWKIAEEIAFEVNDVQLALEVISHRGEIFDVDALQQQLDALNKLIESNRAAVSTDVLLSALSVADDASKSERFEIAASLVSLAKSHAARTKNRPLEKEAIARDKQLKETQKSYEAAQKAIERLKESPDAGKDNSVAGRYYCLVKADWERGLPLLAKGSEERLARAAKQELAAPTAATDRLAVADAWWTSGEGPTFPQRIAILKRAEHWYQLASNGLSGVDKTRAEKRLGVIADAVAKTQGTAAGELLEIALPQGTKLRLREIPAGKFVMGSPTSERGRRPDEAPHTVIISRPFFMGITEVTQAQWFSVTGNNPSFTKGRDLPVEMVSWTECQQFCEVLNRSKLGARFEFRLPTEAEWEYACRAGSKAAYFFGESLSELPEYAWCSLNGGDQTHAVAQLKPNAWGLYDMCGNVAEWCQDFRREYSPEAQTDPAVLDAGFGRVRRGGTPWEDASYCRSASRVSNQQDERRRYLGFRVVVVPR